MFGKTWLTDTSLVIDYSSQSCNFIVAQFCWSAAAWQIFRCFVSRTSLYRIIYGTSFHSLFQKEVDGFFRFPLTASLSKFKMRFRVSSFACLFILSQRTVELIQLVFSTEGAKIFQTKKIKTFSL